MRQKAVSRQVLSGLIDQLSLLMENGVTVDRALHIASEDSADQRVSALAVQLRQSIKKGQALSQALDTLGAKDPLLVPLVRAGEASGQLAPILATLQNHYEERARLRNEVTSALTYPAVLVLASLGSLVALGLYVVPTFRDLFEGRSQSDVPLATQIVFAFSDFLIQHGILTLVILIGGVMAAGFVYRYNEPVRDQVDRFLLQIPGFGPFLAKTEAANVVGVLGVLLSNGVALAPALDLSLAAARNRAVADGLRRALAAVRRGRSLTSALGVVPALPRLVTRLVTVGEETGRLGETTTRAAAALQEEVRAQLKSGVRLLEPLIILFMGGTVGFVVMAMLLAVYGMTDF